MKILPTPTILVTGGSGFIGSNFVHRWLISQEGLLINLDKLTYAGNLDNLRDQQDNENHVFIQGDIQDHKLVGRLLQSYQPKAIINFAAESHVDRSIANPADFIETNVVGTFHLLEQARIYWTSLTAEKKQHFRFLHVSTDEVYGSLDSEAPAFSETHPYAPNSPYSASKAASDHLVRAYHHTYGLPTIITNCSNNYGPYQHPEKLIPNIITKALQGLPIPVYGDGMNIRDWLYVEDHCAALCAVLENGQIGEVYNIGGNQEKTNLDVVVTICSILDELCPDSPYRPHKSLLTFVQDRAGHDRRYAINSQKIQQQLNWSPTETFESGIHKTVTWYLESSDWLHNAQARLNAFKTFESKKL
jgi:dTDP-glucose 4,6-dehydratase